MMARHLVTPFVLVPCPPSYAYVQGVGGLQKTHLRDAEDAAAGRGVQPKGAAREGLLLPERVHREQRHFGGAQHAGGDLI